MSLSYSDSQWFLRGHSYVLCQIINSLGVGIMSLFSPLLPVATDPGPDTQSRIPQPWQCWHLELDDSLFGARGWE